MRTRWKKRFAMFALLGACHVGSFGSALIADDTPEGEKAATEKPAIEKPDPERAAVRVIAINPGKHWLGVQAMPVTDEALKSQLNLQDRLIVVHVVPDSPAGKAGLKQHDILLKLANKELRSIEDLLKVVEENGEKEIELAILRGGKEETIKVKPAERPAEQLEKFQARVREQAIRPEDLRVWVEQGAQGEHGANSPYVLKMFGPGIATAQSLAMRGGGFPNGLSLTISKENDQPAKIVAKKDGKTYETTEDKLGELPEDIRGHVHRAIHGHQAFTVTPEAWKRSIEHQGKAAEEVKKAVEAAKKQALEYRVRANDDAQGVKRRVEILQSPPLDNIKKELEELRREVEKLKGAKSDSEKPAEKQ